MEDILCIINNVDADFNIEKAFVLLNNNNNLFIMIENLINNKKLKSKIINYFIINDNFSILLNAYFSIVNKDIASWINEESNNVKLRILSRDETNDLIVRYQNNGDYNARDELYNHNKGLIWSIVSLYRGKTNLDLEDLFQEGSVGFLRALDKYDVNKGYALSTYATIWIKNSIYKYIVLNDTSIKYPYNFASLYSKIKKYADLLTKKIGREPRLNELSEYLKMPEELIMSVLSSTCEVLSLDEDLFGDKRYSYMVNIPDLAVNVEDEALTNIEYQELIKIINNNLTNRDSRIFILKRGLNNNRVHTLEELSNIFNLSKEAIRLIDKKCEKKIKEIYLKNNNNNNSNCFINKNKQKFLKFAELFDSDIENVLYAISKLKPEEYDFIDNKFGNMVDDIIIEFDADFERFINIYSLINMIIQYNKIDKFIFENLINCNQDELKSVIDRLDLHTFYKAYGKKLNTRNVINEEDRISLIRSYIVLNQSMKGISRRSRTLFDWFSEYSSDEIRCAINELGYKHKLIIYKRFGYSLEELYPMSHNEVALFHTYIKSLIVDNLNKISSDNKKMCLVR